MTVIKKVNNFDCAELGEGLKEWLYKASDGFEYDTNSPMFKAGVEKGEKKILRKIEKSKPILYMAVIKAFREIISEKED